jgi:uncharacterized protein
MPRCLAAASLSALLVLSIASHADAASFDCSRAVKGVETAICEDRALSALDDQMAQSYRALLNRTSGATESRIKADQKNWLRQRNVCGGDSRCLEREYRARIQSIAASPGAAPAPRETTATQENEDQPRGVFGRTTEPVKAKQTEEKPGLLARMIDRMTPNFTRKDEEPQKTEPARRQAEQPIVPAPQEPLVIVGQRPTQKAATKEPEPAAEAQEPARPKPVQSREPETVAAATPAPARQKSVPRQNLEPQVAAAEPVRQKYVLRPAVEQPKQQGKWQDLPTGSSVAAPEVTQRTTTARTETAREPDTTRVKTTRVKPEPAQEPAQAEAPALTYAPENDGEPPAQRILRQEPRVQMIKPLIVRDRPAAAEPTAPAIADEERSASIDDAATAALAPVEPPAPEDIPTPAALPNDGSTLPEKTAGTRPVASSVKEALKSRFDTAYGSPNRIDLLAPVRETRHFDPGRFDIFDEPAGG